MKWQQGCSGDGGNLTGSVQHSWTRPLPFPSHGVKMLPPRVRIIARSSQCLSKISTKSAGSFQDQLFQEPPWAARPLLGSHEGGCLQQHAPRVQPAREQRLGWGSAEQGGLADVDVVLLGTFQPALLFVRTVWFLPPKGSPPGHGEQTTRGEVCALALVLGLLLLQPKETIPENWMVDQKSRSIVKHLPFCRWRLSAKRKKWSLCHVPVLKLDGQKPVGDFYTVTAFNKIYSNSL